MRVPVVCCDDDDVLDVAHNVVAPVDRDGGAAVGVAATVNEEHDRQRRRIAIEHCGWRGPHVEVQTVLLHGHDAALPGRLRAVVDEPFGVAHALPALRRLRRLPAQGTNGRCGKGHAEECRE